VAAASIALTTNSWTALAGFQIRRTRLTAGTPSLSSSRRFTPISGKKKEAPVTLPPGRARLAVVACSAAWLGGVPSVAIMSTLSRTSSAARTGSRS